MGFHRRTVPTYYGGLPVSYDYINNAVSGTPAPADGPKGAGTNAGTYFIAFGEDATSSNSNRANDALAENCDIIDNYVRTSSIVMRYVDVVATASQVDFALTGDIYVGGSGESPAVANDQQTRNSLVHFVDSTNEDDLVIGGVTVTSSIIHDGSLTNVVGVPADGFQTNPTVRSAVALPVGTTVRMYYFERRSFADIIPNKPSEFLSQQMRSLEKIPAALNVHGLDERYRRARAYDNTPPVPWPGTAPVGEEAGSGAWILKDSYPVTTYLYGSSLSAHVGTLDDRDYMFGAGWAHEHAQLALPSTREQRQAHGSGFTFLGAGRSARFDRSIYTPALFGFMHAAKRDSGNPTTHTSDATVIETGDTVNITGATITLNTGWFYKNLSGNDRSSFARGIDIIRLRNQTTGEYTDVTVTTFLTATTGTVRYLDGSEPNLASTTFDIIGWVQPMYFSADNPSSYWNKIWTSTEDLEYYGRFHAETPKSLSTDTYFTERAPSRFYGGDQESTTPVIVWGGYAELDPTSTGAKYQGLSTLYADGGAEFNGTVRAQGSGVTSAVGDAVPALETTIVPTGYKVLWERATTTAVEKSRMFTDISGGTYFTVNAYFDGTDWRRDVVGDASRVLLNNLGQIIRNYAGSDAADSVIDWTEKTQFVTSYTLQHISITTATPAWSNATSSWTTVTGLSKAVTVAVGDIIKIKGEISYAKTGTTNGGQFQLTQGGTAITDSIRWTGTTQPDATLSVSTQFVATAAGSLTFALQGRLATSGADTISTVGDGSLQVEVLRPG